MRMNRKTRLMRNSKKSHPVILLIRGKLLLALKETIYFIKLLVVTCGSISKNNFNVDLVIKV